MAGVLTLEQAEGLKQAYLEIRNLGHRLNLSEISRKVGTISCRESGAMCWRSGNSCWDNKQKGRHGAPSR